MAASNPRTVDQRDRRGSHGRLSALRDGHAQLVIPCRQVVDRQHDPRARVGRLASASSAGQGGRLVSLRAASQLECRRRRVASDDHRKRDGQLRLRGEADRLSQRRRVESALPHQRVLRGAWLVRRHGLDARGDDEVADQRLVRRRCRLHGKAQHGAALGHHVVDDGLDRVRTRQQGRRLEKEDTAALSVALRVVARELILLARSCDFTLALVHDSGHHGRASKVLRAVVVPAQRQRPAVHADQHRDQPGPVWHRRAEGTRRDRECRGRRCGRQRGHRRPLVFEHRRSRDRRRTHGSRVARAPRRRAVRR